MYEDFVEAKPIKWEKYFKGQTPPENRVGNFEDPYFPHGNSILISEKILKHEELIREEIKPENIEWKRLKDIFGEGKYQIFQGKIEAADIKQGSISNCYFLSSIAALTEFPELIYQKFITKKENEYGYYEMAFFIEGEWQAVFIDDYFPCIKGSTQLYFAKPNGNEVWTLLLEKAWAKLNGSYSNIVLGEVGDPLKALTGYSVQFYEIEHIPPSDLWDKIKTSDELNFISCTGTKNEEFVEKFGLVKGHAYSLVSAKEKFHDGRLIKLLKLFNPWGRMEWTGNWSDNSSLWEDSLVEYFGKVSKDDGTFHMELDDYHNYYYSLYICNMMYGANLTSYKFDHPNSHKPYAFLLQLEEDSQIALSVFFKHWRYNREMDFAKKRHFSLVMAKLNELNEVVQVYGDYSGDNRDIEYVNQLTAGKYIIWLRKLSPEQEESFSFVFRVAAVKKYSVICLGEDVDCKLLTHIFISSRTKEVGDKKKFAFEKDVTLKAAGLQAFVGINATVDKYGHLQFKKLENANGFVILHSPTSKDGKTVDICLAPKDSFCVIAGVTENPNFMFQMSAKKVEKKDGQSNCEYKLENINSILNQAQEAVTPFFQDNFPTLEQLKYERHYQEKGGDFKEFYSLDDFKKINAYIHSQLKYLIDNSEDKLILKKEYNGTYLGQVQSGSYIGAKIYENRTQDIYIGSWKNGKFNGKGIIYSQLKNIVTYEGDFLNGLKHGVGKLIQESGEEYFGEFYYDDYQGICQSFFPEINIVYLGRMSNGKKDGVGFEINLSNKKVAEVEYRSGSYVDSVPIKEEKQKEVLNKLNEFMFLKL